MRTRCLQCVALLLAVGLDASVCAAQSSDVRQVSGVVVTRKNEAVRGAVVIASTSASEVRAETNEDGEFQLQVAPGPVTLRVEGKNIAPLQKTIAEGQPTSDLALTIDFVIPPMHQSLVIVASALQPDIERRNDEVYRKTLFSRDDQLLETLDAGINAGQHEGGGKSLEVRRFGFNLDHGGVNGGLKVLVNDIQQNQGTQGHGQGYLGALKSLTPELVQEVDILNGPFSAEYGDFSGLGVVHIRLKESLPDKLTWRVQGGSFGSYRTFLGYSPDIPGVDSFIAYEGSRTDGPFINPLRYKRDNVTGNFTRHMSGDQALGFKLNFGRNDFFSSGQIPLDLVSAGQLDRFGYIDPTDGGQVGLGTLGVYYRKGFASGDSFKVDGFLGRSLLDLYSNFTFYLHDPIRGDAFQQHDSRYQEGANTQYLHLYKLFGRQALLTLGSNFHENQINVGLYPRQGRDPQGVTTSAFAHVTNVAGYAQQGMDFPGARLHVEGGLRWDYFRFQVDDHVTPSQSGVEGAARFQPKAGMAYTPSRRIPLRFSFNYGRGISTQDARGVVQRPDAPRISNTDFYQTGVTYNLARLTLSADAFLIDRSNEQVYNADDGSFEFRGPSRSYGYEGKTSFQITRRLTLNGGLTQVTNSFYRATSPRLYVDSAPHTVANAALTLSGWHDFYGSLRCRHIGNYRLVGSDPSIRASGLDVFDLSVTRPIRRWVDFNFSLDNLASKVYYETQNYFESRVTPAAPIVSRIHGTPGFPIGVTVGATFHLLSKNH
jgi:hypothetical protein